MGLINGLYKASRLLGKTAGTLNDLKVLSTGDPEKIVKRIARKTVNKAAYKGANKINKNIR